jgi:hypothetical protein
VPHVHAHLPHDVTEGGDEPPVGRPGRLERMLELVAVLLLSLTTVATAWSGYQAARWSGEQSQLYATASAHRIAAQRQATASGQLRIDDLLNFNGWLDAHEAGDRRLARIYERRFRPEFVPAFRAWLGQERSANGAPIPGPLYAAEYRSAELERAAEIDEEAQAAFREGTDAKRHDDRYVLSTVFFAAVLFFAGISLRLLWLPLRVFVLGLASALLLGGLVFVLTLPAI